MGKPKISVIIPAYNEEKTIGIVLRKLIENMPKDYEYEIIVVDDGSMDNTAEVVNKISQKTRKVILVKHQSNRGYGEALKSGFNTAKGDIIVTLDADGQHDPRKISENINPIIENEADLVIGSRFLGQFDKGTISLGRKIKLKFLSLLTYILCKKTLTDVTSNYRAYRRKIIEDLEIENKGLGASFEIIFKLTKKGLRIKEVPIIYKKKL